jgi:hypothetical protein
MKFSLVGSNRPHSEVEFNCLIDSSSHSPSQARAGPDNNAAKSTEASSTAQDEKHDRLTCGPA